ncbi:MAG: hypothetical protein ABI831_22830, partial [Betaproteobacteria bacterium]
MSTVRVRLDTSFAAMNFLIGTGKSRGLAAKMRLLEAMDHKSESGPNPRPLQSPGDSEVIWLREDDLGRLGRYQEQHGLSSVHEAASQLIYAAAIAAAASEEAAGTVQVPGATPSPRTASGAARGTLERVNDGLGATERREQTRFRDALSAFVTGPNVGKVLFAEASTGVGKTRAFLTIAYDWISVEANPPAVLTLPTYMGIWQAAAAWKNEIQSAFDDAPDAMILLGQNEFVSESAIRSFLEIDTLEVQPDWLDDALLTDAVAWVEAGAPPAPGSVGAATWTVAGLMAATGERWPALDDVRLPARLTEEVDEDLGLAAYRDQFIHAER